MGQVGTSKKKKWRFCAFLIKGSSKTPQKQFWEKSMSKTFVEKVEMSFFLPSFPIDFFYSVFGRFSA
jgi:hypothetical protein